MSEKNIEVARQAIDVWNSGNMDRVRDLYDPYAVMIYDPAGNWPEPGPFFGRDAIMRQFHRLRDALDSDSLDLIGDPVAVGDRVVVHAIWRGAGRGPQIEQEMAWIYIVHGGLIVRAEFFADHSKALEAAGLQE
jgi:ketosteroid isomerase-like protein